MLRLVSAGLVAMLLGTAANAQETPVAMPEDYANIDSCTGIMKAKDLIAAANRLMTSKEENDVFFGADCLIIAAYKGSSEAQYLLGNAYRDGTGVPMSTIYAYKWAQISIANGNDKAKPDIENLENFMNIDELKLARKEISDFLDFEKRLASKTDSKSVKMQLKDQDLTNVTPEQLQEIEKIKSEIDNLFYVTNDNVKNADKNTDSLRRNIIDDGGYDMENERRMREMEMNRNMNRNAEMENARIRAENDRIRMENEARRQQNEAASPQGGAAAASGGEKRRSRTVDFNTDKYNPQFAPPPAP